MTVQIIYTDHALYILKQFHMDWLLFYWVQCLQKYRRNLIKWRFDFYASLSIAFSLKYVFFFKIPSEAYVQKTD